MVRREPRSKEKPLGTLATILLSTGQTAPTVAAMMSYAYVPSCLVQVSAYELKRRIFFRRGGSYLDVTSSAMRSNSSVLPV